MKEFFTLNLVLIMIFSLISCEYIQNLKIQTDTSNAVTHEQNSLEPSTTSAEWQSSYSTLLSNLYESEKTQNDVQFYLRDLDNNSIPELIIKKGLKITVYTFNGAIIEIGKHDFLTGTTRLLFSNNLEYPGIFNFNIGGGRKWYRYVTVKSNKLIIEDLWNENYTGKTKEWGLDEIEEVSTDKQLIKESKKSYENGNDLEFQELEPSNFSPEIPACTSQ